MVRTLKKITKYILKNWLFRKYAIVTKDKNNNQSFLTIGSQKASSRYKSVYLGKDANASNSLIINSNIHNKLDKFHTQYGLICIKDSSLATSNRNLFVMQPEFIVLEIPLPDTYEVYIKSITNDARNNLKKVQKVGFTCFISNDKTWVDTFYNNYYIHTMIDRHSEDASITAKWEMRSIINKPGAEFVKLFLDGKCVAAALTLLENEKYICHKIGYLNGDVSLLQKGIVTAIYEFRIKRAYELGCKAIVLGGTPPFLENGVFKYKAKWQARFCPDLYFNKNYLLFNPFNNFCHNFLQSNSLVVFGLKNTLIVLSSKKPTESGISSNTLDDIKSWYILSPNYIENYASEMEDLPEHLRHWYEKIY